MFVGLLLKVSIYIYLYIFVNHVWDVTKITFLFYEAPRKSQSEYYYYFGEIESSRKAINILLIITLWLVFIEQLKCNRKTIITHFSNT